VTRYDAVGWAPGKAEAFCKNTDSAVNKAFLRNLGHDWLTKINLKNDH